MQWSQVMPCTRYRRETVVVMPIEESPVSWCDTGWGYRPRRKEQYPKGVLFRDGGLTSCPGSGGEAPRSRNGYLGTSDGWSDLRSDDSMDWNYTSAPDGTV